MNFNTENLLPDYSPNEAENISLYKQTTLRRLVGALGMALPILLLFFNYLHNGATAPIDSISHYYFTRAGTIFIMVVSLLAFFLLVYKGYDKWEFILSSIAGICAILLLYYPTSNITTFDLEHCKCEISKILERNEFREAFHFTMAGIFLGCLAIMSIFLFTKKKGDKSGFRMPTMKGKNYIFVTCGIVMILAMIAIPTNVFGIIDAKGFDDIESDYNKLNVTFWCEVIALEAFGIAWFTKLDLSE